MNVLCKIFNFVLNIFSAVLNVAVEAVNVLVGGVISVLSNAASAIFGSPGSLLLLVGLGLFAWKFIGMGSDDDKKDKKETGSSTEPTPPAQEIVRNG